MKIQFDVIRFDHHDVIATSTYLCKYNGVQHIEALREGEYDPDTDTTTVFAKVITYPKDRSIQVDAVENVTVPGKQEFQRDMWYHYNGTGYTLCVPQEH
jgi:hypothetical protein